MVCQPMSLPPREAWIEISGVYNLPACLFHGRFPRGKRGLKYSNNQPAPFEATSLPPREAWIEIGKYDSKIFFKMSLPPREAWIEIFPCIRIKKSRRTGSLPPREAWIEILPVFGFAFNHFLSLPPREAWIEIGKYLHYLEARNGRFPRGKRGLKWSHLLRHGPRHGRFPRGKRGLKSLGVNPL